MHIWCDADNTFRLKGSLADDDHVREMHQREPEKIMTHIRRLERHERLDPFESYPLPG